MLQWCLSVTLGSCGVKISNNSRFFTVKTLFNIAETPVHTTSSTALSFHCHCAKNYPCEKPQRFWKLARRGVSNNLSCWRVRMEKGQWWLRRASAARPLPHQSSAVVHFFLTTPHPPFFSPPPLLFLACTTSVSSSPSLILVACVRQANILYFCIFDRYHSAAPLLNSSPLSAPSLPTPLRLVLIPSAGYK